MPTRRSRVQSEDEEENFDPNMEEEDQEEVNSDTEVTAAAATARPKRGQKGKETNKPKAFVASDTRPGRKRVLIAEGKLIGQHLQFRLPCCNHFL